MNDILLDGSTDTEPLANFLTEEEAAVFVTLDAEQQDRYLAATASFEDMQAYLNNPDEPAAAKQLLSLDSWK